MPLSTRLRPAIFVISLFFTSVSSASEQDTQNLAPQDPTPKEELNLAPTDIIGHRENPLGALQGSPPVSKSGSLVSPPTDFKPDIMASLEHLDP